MQQPKQFIPMCSLKVKLNITVGAVENNMFVLVVPKSGLQVIITLSIVAELHSFYVSCVGLVTFFKSLT